jgi:pimeloyl-ACP methyl ester carboxylesterase
MLFTYRRRLLVITIAMIVFYFLLLLFFYLFRSRLIYQRTELPKSHKFEFAVPYQEYIIDTKDNDSLNLLHFKTDGNFKGLIFYLHGNADNLARWGTYAIDFTTLGYDVVMFDYRGYGKSTGIPNDQNLYEDAALVYNWAIGNVPTTKIVIYGRSLGSAVATQLAVAMKPDLLVLETPFADFKDVIYWPLKPALTIFPVEANFSNKDHLGLVSCRKVIFHGTDDWVVPLSSAQKLKPLLGPDDEFIIIEGGSHKNLRDFKLYHTTLSAALK